MPNYRNDGANEIPDREHNLTLGLGLGLGLGLDIESHSHSSSGLKKKCHLCLRLRHTFFCQDCVEKGNFTHSSARYPERFAEKKLRFYDLSQELKNYNKRIQEALARKIKASDIKTAIQQLQERIQLFQLSVEETKQKITQREEMKMKLDEEIEEKRIRGPRTAERIQKMLRYNQLYQERYKTKKKTLEMLNSSLKKVKQENIRMLLEYIFPLSKVFPDNTSEEHLRFEGAMQELAEAQQLSFVREHWDIPDNRECQYKIIDAYLPESGNYSDYNTWVLKNKESPSAENIIDNPANRISAALTHTAQLVAVLAYFLDIRLPKNVCYSEFCGHEMSENQFALKVAKLNINIIHLCLTQNVDSSALSPKCTMRNLLHLFDPDVCDLGRLGTVEMSSELVECMMQSLFEDMNFASDDEEDNSHSDSEDWETLPLPTFEPFAIPTKGSSSVTTIVHSQVTESRPRQNPQTTSTLGGGLISSVASFWRAATGQK